MMFGAPNYGAPVERQTTQTDYLQSAGQSSVLSDAQPKPAGGRLYSRCLGIDRAPLASPRSWLATVRSEAMTREGYL